MATTGTSVTAWQRLNEVFEAAVDLPPKQQTAFLDESCGNDRELRSDAERMLAAARRIGENGFLSENVFGVGARMIAGDTDPVTREGRRIGNYRIVSQLARGGMGVVYLAERDDFRQQVALKLIRDGIDSSEILRRFRIERDVLASLNHPNIARLLDGGVTDDGLPFLAMEYVDGVAIDQYCNGENIALRSRLHLFRKVCSAVAYAHQNLTVHRDIKPSNILVTADGEPKLLDFGISKILAEGATRSDTATANRLLTPEYASPEQLLGKRISTASDVYSLGVLLYELLTGRRPFELEDRSAFEIVEAICQTEPPAPSSWRDPDLIAESSTAGNRQPATGTRVQVTASQLRGDLDNIILTALRKDPDRRYSSVEQFSEDIRRYLDGLPVIARPATLKYRAGKFIRRNRVAVAFAGVAAAALLTGTGVASWQAVVARSEKARAEQRFNEVRALANTFVNDWNAGLREESVSPEIRGRLADISSDYLSKLAADSNDPDVLREAAAAQIKLGHEYAYFMIDGDKARRAFQTAERIARSLVADNAADRAARAMLTLSLMKYNEFFGPEDLDASIASRREQIALRELDLADAPDDVSTLRDLAIVHEQLADDLRRGGRGDEAASHLSKADEHYKRRITILETLPQTAENLSRLASSLTLRAANLDAHLSRTPEAIDVIRRAIDTARDSMSISPADRTAAISLINAHSASGSIFKGAGDHPRAIEEFQASIRTNREFAGRARDAFFTRREYDALLDAAESQHLLGQNAAAHRTLLECFRVRREWSARAENRDLPKTFSTHAFLFELGGRLLGRMGRAAEAEAAFDEAASYLERLQHDARRKPERQYQLASLMIGRGDLSSGLLACQPAVSEFTDLDAACVPGALTRDPRRLARAAEHYRRSAELMAAPPDNNLPSYLDRYIQQTAAARLAVVLR